MTAGQIATSAIAYLAEGHRWRKGIITTDIAGVPVSSESEDRYYSSLGGAVVVACWQLLRMDDHRERSLSRTMWALNALCLFEHGQSLSIWEDAPERTFSDVAGLVQTLAELDRKSLLAPLTLWLEQDNVSGKPPARVTKWLRSRRVDAQPAAMAA